MFWYGFVIGMFAGVFFGGAVMAMMVVSGNEARREEKEEYDDILWDLPPPKTDRRNIWDPEA